MMMFVDQLEPGEEIVHRRWRAPARSLVPRQSNPAGVPPRVLVTPVADWDEAADGATLAHRDTELDTLSRLVDDERRRLVGVIGIGGIGKTSLVVAFG